jgi:Tfp pilus assembly protein PilV
MVALVVISVGLIAIVGLIPQGIQSSRSAADNTLVATIVHDTFNDLRRQALTAWPPLGAALITDYDVTGTNAAPPLADRYFHVTLNPQSTTAYLQVITATVTTRSAPASTNFFVTEIANYQK